MAEFLLELLSEEIPARMQKRAAEDLKRLVTDRLGALGVATADARAFATPRRLTLLVKGLSQQQPDVAEERKGPRVGAPEQAIQGFLRANGLTSLDGCEKRTVGKAEFWYLVVAKPGGPTADILRQVIPEVVASFPWPKSMRWGRSKRSWVRPLRRVLCLFGGKPLDFSLDFGGIVIRSGSETEGHRFLAPGAVAVASYADYRQKLRARKVMLNAVDRMLLIKERGRVLAQAEGLVVKEDEGLLEE
ncbi:MAG: glycine--tRNA ligase subunit beta, partial [Alphaproteobacteria bacterium]|nr:glycine--tRNA ligase subunit beta [Alphaproteobacteria bacterium]